MLLGVTRTVVAVLVLTCVQCVQQKAKVLPRPHIQRCNDRYLQNLTNYMDKNLNEIPDGRIEVLDVPANVYSTCMFAIHLQVTLSAAKKYCSAAHPDGKFPVASELLLTCLRKTQLVNHVNKQYFVYTFLDNDQLSKLNNQTECATGSILKATRLKRTEENQFGVPLKLLSMLTDKDASANETWAIEAYNKQKARIICELPNPPEPTTVTSTTTVVINETSSSYSSPIRTSASTAQPPLATTALDANPEPMSAESPTRSTSQQPTSSHYTGPEIAEENTLPSTVDPDLINIYILLGFLMLLFVLLIILAVLVVARSRREDRHKADRAVREKEKKGDGKRAKVSVSPPDASTRSFSPTEALESPPSPVSKPEVVVPTTRGKNKTLKVAGHGPSMKLSGSSQLNSSPVHHSLIGDGDSSDLNKEDSFSKERPPMDQVLKPKNKPSPPKIERTSRQQSKIGHSANKPKNVSVENSSQL